jgi:cysteine synthase
VKDRAAKSLVQGLIDSGKLVPGGTIVEGTAGNTGIGLTLVANSLGYKTVIVIPRTQTQEKKDALRQAGATLIEVDAKPYTDPNNYIKISGRIADEIPGAVWANQFDVGAHTNSVWHDFCALHDLVEHDFHLPAFAHTSMRFCFVVVGYAERGQSQSTL